MNREAGKNPGQEASHADRSARQFSIRSLLVATAITSVLCCTYFILPVEIGSFILLLATLLLMPAMLAGLVYGRGQSRAFAVGALPILSVVFLWIPWLGYNALYEFGRYGPKIKSFYAVATVLIFASGCIGQAVREWCLHRQNPGKRG